jgi:hypothetical protein
MFFSKQETRVIAAIVGCALSAYGAGEHLHEYSGPTPGTLLGITTGSTLSAVTMNPTTFAAMIELPPVIPPGDSQQQG